MTVPWGYVDRLGGEEWPEGGGGGGGVTVTCESDSSQLASFATSSSFQ